MDVADAEAPLGSRPSECPQTRLIAHRGRAGDDPENTVEAIPGLPPWVDGVEVDVRRRSDGVCILMHDAKVDRTTTGKGRVESLDRTGLKKLRVDGWARIPTLKRYLEAAAKTWLDQVLIDVKESSVAAAEAAAEVATASRAVPRCVLLVRAIEQLEAVRASHPDLRIGYLGLTHENAESRFEAAKAHAVEVMLIYPGDREYLDNRGLVARGRACGIAVGASTINGDAALAAAYEDECALVLTDRIVEVGSRHITSCTTTPAT